MNQVGSKPLAEFPCCRTPVGAGRGSLRTADPLRASLPFAELGAARGCRRHRRVTGAPGRDSADPAPPAFIAYSPLKPWECKKAANPSGAPEAAGMWHWGDRPGSPRPAAGGGSRGQRPGCSCGCSSCTPCSRWDRGFLLLLSPWQCREMAVRRPCHSRQSSCLPPSPGTSHSRRGPTTLSIAPGGARVLKALAETLIFWLLPDFPHDLIKYSLGFRIPAFSLRTVDNCAVL